LLGLIAGLVPVTEGRIVIGDRPVSGAVPPDIGYLFQRDALLPWKTALQNVSLPLTIRGTPGAETRERATAWLRRVGLAGFEGYYPHPLSGGVRQRGALATPLIYRPALLLVGGPVRAPAEQARNLPASEPPPPPPPAPHPH